MATIAFCSQTKTFFAVEEMFNKQNDNVYAWTLAEARDKIDSVQVGHYLASLTAGGVGVFTRLWRPSIFEQRRENRGKDLKKTF